MMRDLVRLLISMFCIMALALSGCARKSSKKATANTPQAQTQQTVNNLQSELQKLQARLQKSEAYNEAARAETEAERARADQLAQKSQSVGQMTASREQERARLAQVVAELEQAIAGWQRRAKSAEVAASELQAVKQKLIQTEEELRAAKEELAEYEEDKDSSEDEDEDDNEEEIGAPEKPRAMFNEKVLRPGSPSENAELEADSGPSSDDSDDGEASVSLPTPSPARNSLEKPSAKSREESVISKDSTEKSAGQTTEPAGQTTEPAVKPEVSANDGESKSVEASSSVPAPAPSGEVTEICQTVASLKKELQELEAKAAKTEEDNAKIDTVKSDIDRLVKSNGKGCDEVIAASPEPAPQVGADAPPPTQENVEVSPVPQRETAANDEKVKVVTEALTQVTTKKMEVDLAVAEVTKIKEELGQAAEAKKPALQEKLKAAEQKVSKLKEELAPLEQKLKSEIGETSTEIQTGELVVKAEEFLKTISDKAGSVEKDVTETVTGLNEEKDELKAKAAAVAEEIRNSNLNEEIKKQLLDRIGIAFSGIESTPVYLMARLKTGDLQGQKFPFFITVYGAVKKEEVEAIKKMVSESELAKATGLVESSASMNSSVREVEGADKAVFHHRHLLQGNFEELSALIGELEKKGALVSVKPLEKVEVDTLVSWTPVKEELREKLNLRVMLTSKIEATAGLSFEKLNQPAEMLGLKEECAHFSVECAQKLKSLGVLSQPAGEPATLAERSYTVLALVLQLAQNNNGKSSPAPQPPKDKEKEPSLVPEAAAFASADSTAADESGQGKVEESRVVEAGKKVLAALIGEQALKEYLGEEGSVQEAHALKDIRIETRIWAIEQKSKTEDPVASNLLYDISRDSLKDGTASFSQTAEQYILEDASARYYLLPLNPAAALPQEISTDPIKLKELLGGLVKEFQ